MTRLREAETHDIREEIFPCSCVGVCGYVRISWDESDPESRWLWLENVTGGDTFLQRLKAAARIILGREAVRHDITLRPESVDSLVEFLTRDQHQEGSDAAD